MVTKWEGRQGVEKRLGNRSLRSRLRIGPLLFCIYRAATKGSGILGNFFNKLLVLLCYKRTI